LKEVRQKYPDFQLKLIFTFARSAPPAVIAERLKTALALRKKHPDIIVGFDLVNEEDPRKDKPHPLIDFLDLFLQTARDARTQGTTLPYFFHAGETNKTENENVYDALLLNTRRIGHGLALIKHPHLLDLVRRRGIAVEACPISNQVLGYIPDLRNHPGVHWLRSGVPVTINPDDPGMMGYTFSYDFYEVFMAWDLNLAELKQLAMNSLQHSALNPQEQQSAMRSWRAKWSSWVDWLNSQAGNTKPAD
jgi:adenosine deaminase CECR1